MQRGYNSGSQGLVESKLRIFCQEKLSSWHGCVWKGALLRSQIRLNLLHSPLEVTGLFLKKQPNGFLFLLPAPLFVCFPSKGDLWLYRYSIRWHADDGPSPPLAQPRTSPCSWLAITPLNASEQSCCFTLTPHHWHAAFLLVTEGSPFLRAFFPSPLCPFSLPLTCGEASSSSKNPTVSHQPLPTCSSVSSQLCSSQLIILRSFRKESCYLVYFVYLHMYVCSACTHKSCLCYIHTWTCVHTQTYVHALTLCSVEGMKTLCVCVHIIAYVIYITQV